MAKHVIAELYTFAPSTRTITIINRFLRREQLLLITNTTRNVVLYNFSDPTLSGTFTNTTSGSTPTTTIVLNFNTASHSSTDKIAILVEETDETFRPTEVLFDPVNKFRVSQPQALIDTDFEYGTQPTKWESISLTNNRPFAYYNPYSQQTYTDITATNNSRTYTVSTTTPPAVGTPVFISDSNFAGADGLFIVDSIVAGTSFSYTGKSVFTGTTGSINISGVTTIFNGSIFTGASIAISSITYSGTAITVTTSVSHGLSIGNEIALTGTTASTNAPNGSWIVATITSPTVFVFYAINTPTGSVTGGTLYVRSQGNFNHRAFDGGVTFSTNCSSHNQQLIRQTRRYFRYQSGKGLQLSTGTILKPNINVDQITSSGTTVTVVFKQQHNILPGTTISVSGCDQSAYNGTFTVATVLNAYRITYTAATTPSTATASGAYIVSVNSWYGAATRVGMFDTQNGLFFEFDGQTLWAVRRSSTYQLSGFISVNSNSTTVSGVTVNGVSTLFSKQLLPNDWIVIKGMSYRVVNIVSDTSMTITPAYRGPANLAQGIVSKTNETRWAQSTWNLDRCDGTGPSGYNIDLTKMQMFYIDYSWYGAGFIRWGFRGLDGTIIYAHKIANNNVNSEAYMRSGNLPARYETNTFSKYAILANTATSGATTIDISDTSGWPSAGTLLLRNGSQQEYINYTGITGNTLTGCTRGQAGATQTVTTTANSAVLTSANTVGVQIGQYVTGTGITPGTYVTNFTTNTSVNISLAATASGSISAIFAPMGQTAQTFTYSATAPTAAELHAPVFSSTISHWGTSVIMDGRYDDDKSFVFTRGMTTSLSISTSATNALMSFRISPSVSNGITGTTLGVREIINRMQMVLRQLDVYSNGAFLITLVLNGTVSSATPNWTAVGGSSLAQWIPHSAGTTITGGEVIYGFFLNPPSTVGGNSYVTTQQELSLVRDLGNGILGGGTAVGNTGIFPDGPDVVTVVAQNVGSGASSINARLSWTEAQA